MREGGAAVCVITADIMLNNLIKTDAPAKMIRFAKIAVGWSALLISLQLTIISYHDASTDAAIIRRK